MKSKQLRTTLRPNKLNVWLYHYLNEKNPNTFFNKSESARAAGYKANNENNLYCVGWQNYKKLQPLIEKWLDENGLSEASLKSKLLELMDAKEKRFFSCAGKITDQVEVDALETQRKALEMAMKVKGMFEKDNAQQKSDLYVLIDRADRRAEEMANKVCREMEADKNKETGN